jgi:hypothetical protein
MRRLRSGLRLIGTMIIIVVVMVVIGMMYLLIGVMIVNTYIGWRGC